MHDPHDVPSDVRLATHEALAILARHHPRGLAVVGTGEPAERELLVDYAFALYRRRVPVDSIVPGARLWLSEATEREFPSPGAFARFLAEEERKRTENRVAEEYRRLSEEREAAEASSSWHNTLGDTWSRVAHDALGSWPRVALAWSHFYADRPLADPVRLEELARFEAAVAAAERGDPVPGVGPLGPLVLGGGR